MISVAGEREANLAELTKELMQRVVGSRYWNKKTCAYQAPRVKMSSRVKWLIDEIDRLAQEKD